MKRIGIMGGTFDPIHIAHLIIAQSAIDEYNLDEIVFLTSGTPPHKLNKPVSDSAIRHLMVCHAIKGNKSFTPSDYEVKRSDYSYTSNTLLHFKDKYPLDQLFFIIGGDSLGQFHTWHCPDIIARSAAILVYPRFGEDLSEDIKNYKAVYGTGINVIHSPYIDISSSMIRKMVSDGKSITYMVPSGVEEIIKENRLYQK